MAVRQRGTTWQADLQHGGQRYRETFGSQREAEAWERRAREALKKGQPIPTVQEGGGAYSTMQRLLDVIVATDWSRKRGCTAQIAHAQAYVDFVGPKLAPEVGLTQERTDAFVSEVLLPKRIAGGTINRYLSAISKMGKKALSAGIIPRKIDMPWAREGEARLRWFSDQEEALILQTLRQWSLPEWADFFIVLLDTGARTWTEAASIRWEDISSAPAMVTFWLTKNGESRAVPLTTRAYEAIQRQHGQAAGPFKRLDKDTGRRIWDRLRATLPGLDDTVWYTARHTFASRLVQRGVDLYRVQRLMGHKSITMTTRYAKLAPAHLIEAIQVLEPKRELRVVA